jgi:hypothetical protein
MTNAMTNAQMTTASEMPVRVLLAGPDTLYFSCDLPLSGAMRDRLSEEKTAAQPLAEERRVQCPEWLGARVCPQGAKGGYAFLIETEDFSVKLLGKRIQNRPSVYFEMRSNALHTHPEGAQGACRAALAWVREKLYSDQSSKLVKDAVSFEATKLSRADVHVDYQGGYAPSLDNVSEELRCFIRPGKTKGALYFQGSRPTGYAFGKGHVHGSTIRRWRPRRKPTTATPRCSSPRTARCTIRSKTYGAWSSSCDVRAPRGSSCMRRPKKLTMERRLRRS